jgi:hypothetical protein
MVQENFAWNSIGGLSKNEYDIGFSLNDSQPAQNVPNGRQTG